MGRRALDKLFLDWIVQSGHEHVSFVGPNEREWLKKRVEGLGIKVDIIDSDPKFDNPIDAIFDEWDPAPLVIVFNVEKHFPLGQKIAAEMILVGDNEQHNGDCNPIDSCEKMIMQNRLHTVYNQINNTTRYIVWGSNAD